MTSLYIYYSTPPFSLKCLEKCFHSSWEGSKGGCCLFASCMDAAASRSMLWMMIIINRRKWSTKKHTVYILYIYETAIGSFGIGSTNTSTHSNNNILHRATDLFKYLVRKCIACIWVYIIVFCRWVREKRCIDYMYIIFTKICLIGGSDNRCIGV